VKLEAKPEPKPEVKVEMKTQVKSDDKWTCPVCMVPNEKSAATCVCCEAKQPGYFSSLFLFLFPHLMLLILDRRSSAIRKTRSKACGWGSDYLLRIYVWGRPRRRFLFRNHDSGSVALQ